MTCLGHGIDAELGGREGQRDAGMGQRGGFGPQGATVDVFQVPGMSTPALVRSWRS
jgi:hypothetical protein